MTPTPRQLKGAGIDVSALATAEARIAKYERAFRRILRSIDDVYPCGQIRSWVRGQIARVYQPPKQRKAKP